MYLLYWQIVVIISWKLYLNVDMGAEIKNTSDVLFDVNKEIYERFLDKKHTMLIFVILKSI